jgi:putative tricarboxylic transport membrane protein
MGHLLKHMALKHMALKHLAQAGIALAIAVSAIPAQAQLELKIMAPAAPGGGWDAAARSLQQAMLKSGVAKSVQVMNVPGAGGTVGLAQFVNTAKGDGSQLMVGGITMVGAIIANKPPVNLDMVTPIARLTGDRLVIAVPASSPHKTVEDLAAAVKADVGKVTWAGGSAGGLDHILSALFTKAAGGDASKLNYIAYSGGGEAIAAIVGGKVTAGISGYSEFEGQIKAGKMRALAVSSAQRVDGADVPTLKERGLDIEVLDWRCVVAAPGISTEQRKVLVEAMAETVKSGEWTEILKARGWDNYYLPADEFSAFIKSEQTRIEEVLKSIGLAK